MSKGYVFMFSTLSHKLQDFRKKIIELKVCVLISSTTVSDTFLILRRNITKPYICLHVQYRIFLSDFNKTCISATYFGNNNQILNSMKTRSVPAELFCEKRRTDGRSDGRTDGQTWQSELSLFTIFRTRLKLRYWHKLFKFTFYCVSKCLFFTISVCHMEWHHLISL